MSTGSVLILDTHLKQGLVACRSLESRGLSVTAGSPKQWTSSRFSNTIKEYITHPPAAKQPEAFLQAITGELTRSEYDMLLPIEESTVETVVKHRDRFEDLTAIPFPSYETLSVGLSKQRTIEAARRHDISHPKTVFSEGNSVQTVDETLTYPIVVKPIRGEGRKGVSVCESYGSLQRAVDADEMERGSLLFQEYIPNGGECGVYTLYDRSGELSALTVQKRLRSKPPEGGASTYRETITNPEMVAQADRLLSSVDWTGAAMVEFRIDSRTGEPQLIEINPRLWGSLALSVFADVDFPYLLYKLSISDEIPPDTTYRPGVQARCLFTDFVQVLQREDTIRALGEYLTPPSKPCRYDIVSREDPLPMLGQLIDWGLSVYQNPDVR